MEKNRLITDNHNPNLDLQKKKHNDLRCYKSTLFQISWKVSLDEMKYLESINNFQNNEHKTKTLCLPLLNNLE